MCAPRYTQELLLMRTITMYWLGWKSPTDSELLPCDCRGVVEHNPKEWCIHTSPSELRNTLGEWLKEEVDSPVGSWRITEIEVEIEDE